MKVKFTGKKVVYKGRKLKNGDFIEVCSLDELGKKAVFFEEVKLKIKSSIDKKKINKGGKK